MQHSNRRSQRIVAALSFILVALVTTNVLAGIRSYGPTIVIAVPTATKPASSGTVPFNPGDDRLNQRDLDAGASAAVYCRSGDFHIYRINDQSQGMLALVVTKAQIDAVGVPVGANALIASADVPLGQIQVWRLTTGEFQLIAAPVRAGGELYVFIWQDCQIRR